MRHVVWFVLWLVAWSSGARIALLIDVSMPPPGVGRLDASTVVQWTRQMHPETDLCFIMFSSQAIRATSWLSVTRDRSLIQAALHHHLRYQTHFPHYYANWQGALEHVPQDATDVVLIAHSDPTADDLMAPVSPIRSDVAVLERDTRPRQQPMRIDLIRIGSDVTWGDSTGGQLLDMQTYHQLGDAVWSGTLALHTHHARAPNTCIDDISPLNLNCVANDISSTVVITQLVGPPVCARNFPIDIGLEITVTTTATTRYDVGIWIANDGGDALTGMCSAFALQPASTTNLDLDVVGGLGPYKNEVSEFNDLSEHPKGTDVCVQELGEPADTCGDMSSAENGGSIITRLGDQLVTVNCGDSTMPPDNALDANLCLSYGNGPRTGTPCTTGTDTIPSQASKCNCQTIDFFTIVVGDPPVAVDDTFGTAANGTVCHSVLDNDFEGDPNGAQFNISTLALCGGPDPDIGTLEVVEDQICFTPDPEVSAGNATFCYTICNEWFDGTNPEFCSNATNNVVFVGEPPVCQDDFDVGTFGVTAMVDVLSNDAPPGSAPIDPAQTTVPTDPFCGTYVGTTLLGELQLENVDGFDGNCSFTYKVCTTESICATCNVTVEFRRPPECMADADTTLLDVPVETDVLANDAAFTYPLDPSSVNIIVPPSPGGTITNINATTGAIEFTPPLATFGVFVYDYQICDTVNLCSSCTVTVTVNEPPTCAPLPLEHVIVNDTLITDISAAVTPGTIGGGVLDFSTTAVLDGPYFGTIDNINPTNGDITYTPNVAFVGMDNYTYTICQTDGQCCSNVVTIAVHEGPMCMADVYSIEADSSMLVLDVLANDFPGTEPLDPASVTVVIPPTQGTIDAINPGTGAITYTPNAAYVGPDSFEYQVCDLAAVPQCCTSLVSLNVVASPVAVNDTTLLQSGQMTVIFPATNDPGGTHPVDPTSCSLLTLPVVGTAVITNPATCEVKYTSVLGDVSTQLVEYEICDTSPNPLGPFCTTAWIIINVVDGPTAVDDVASTTQDINVVIDVLANDVPGTNPLFPSATTIEVPPSNGVIVGINSGTGAIEYDPNPMFCGMDSFVYRVVDTASFFDTATVNVTVNCPPTAVDDGAMAMTGEQVCIDVLANNIPGTSPINASSVELCSPGGPINGTVLIQPDGQICYTSGPGFEGIDTFMYRVSDENGLVSNCATVTVVVQLMTTTTTTTTTGPGTTTTGLGTTTSPDTTTAPPTTTPAIANVTGTCTGRVFNDINGNQVQDGPGAARMARSAPGAARGGARNDLYKRLIEFSIPGVTVTLLDACDVLHVGVSDQNGDVILPGVCPGPATLTIIVPEGMELTTLPNPRQVLVPPGNGTHSLFPPGSSGFGIRTSDNLSKSQTVFVIVFASLLGIILLSCCGLLGVLRRNMYRGRNIVIRETHAHTRGGKTVDVIDVWRNVARVRARPAPHDAMTKAMQSAVANQARGSRPSLIRIKTNQGTKKDQ